MNYTRLLLVSVISISTFSCSQKKDQGNLPAWALGPFERPAEVKPVLEPTNATFLDPMSGKMLAWEQSDVFNPAATIKGDSMYVLYRAEDNSAVGIGSRTSRIGLAGTTDGIHYNRRTVPVLFPAVDAQKIHEWPGGCEDPRVARTADGRYVMLYTQWNRKIPRLAVAISSDLTHWEKYGPVFKDAYQGKYYDMATKSASIITKVTQGQFEITQIQGKYWMYWGEQHVYAATSTDLIHWTPLEDGKGQLKILMSPRKGYFDSQLTECGPPAVWTKDGIVLLYNGKNATDQTSAKAYTAGAYSAGQVLFDSSDPTKILARLEKPFFKPEAAFEKSGQYPAGTVFVEGMVLYKNKLYMYYGCADSKVGVAVADANAALTAGAQ